MIRLKELREKRHSSMRQIAQQLGIPYTTYVNYEKGIREPNSEMLVLLSDFFDVSIDYLIGRTDYPEIRDGLYNGITFPGRCVPVYDKNGKKKGYACVNKSIKNIQAAYIDENLEKYRALDAHSKKLVDLVLETEYERTEQAKKSDQ